MLKALTERLSLYGEALKLWGTRYLDALSSRLDEVSALSEAQERSLKSVPMPAHSLSDVGRDLALLQAWPSARSDSAASA
jgi:hypothetical protein